MSSASSQSDQINDFQDLKSKWSDIEQKLTNLINHKIDGNSISINKLYIEKLTSFIKLMVRLSNNFKSENWNLNEQIDEKFIKKMKDCVIVNSKLLKDTAFFEIKNFVGQNLQAASLVILKFYAFGSLINLILKSECSLKIAKIEEIKSFHIFVLNYLTSLLIAKNFFHLNYFKLIDEKFQISYLSEFNFIKILNKTFKYSLLNSLIYHEQDASLLEFCEIFLFKVLKEKENFQGFSESILGLFEVFFKAMGQNYLQELYILLKKANYPKDLNNNLDKLFFLNCGDEIRKYIFEEIKAKKPEEIFQFFEILKPLFFNDLLHFKPKAYFCFEKITEEDHLSLSNELLENFTNYFESKLLNEFELNVQIISQGNFSNILNFESFEGLIQIITCFMLNEYISKNLDYGLVDFLLNLEKSYRFLIPIGTFHKTVNIIIRNLFEILVVKNNSQDLKFQETFKLFSIVAKDNSFEGMINLSKFLRILSFATVPSNYKNQVNFLSFFNFFLVKICLSFLNYK